jgi:preprotein translocase SecF subunit
MFFRRLNWNVVGWFPIVSSISYAVIIAGMLMMGYNYVTKGYFLSLGLSFTGGTDVTVKYDAPTSKVAIAQALASIGVTDAQVNTLAKQADTLPNERYTMSTQTAFGNETDRLWAALNKAGHVDRSQSQVESVGPSLSREYLIKALWALVIAISIQFVYIAFRFGWNYIFGTVVVIALVRDSLMMIGIYAISGRRADDAFLAAVLTVIGYSVMDTIVILDRIRENVKLMPGEAYDRIVNTSILQTMTRSVYTLLTVVITLVALLLFGGASLQNFAFALLVGIVSGGYHSIFYSAPLVVRLRAQQQRRAARRRVTERRAALERPRTVAEARAQTAAGRAAALSRDEVIAARKERRAKGRSQERAPAPSVPTRYKKRRPDAPVVRVVDVEQPVAEEPTEEADVMDPLDAQTSGQHERELELGHEEITLNLADHPLPESSAHEGANEEAAATPHDR